MHNLFIFYAAPEKVKWFEKDRFFRCDRIFKAQNTIDAQNSKLETSGNYSISLETVPQEISEFKQLQVQPQMCMQAMWLLTVIALFLSHRIFP